MDIIVDIENEESIKKCMNLFGHEIHHFSLIFLIEVQVPQGHVGHHGGHQEQVPGEVQ